MEVILLERIERLGQMGDMVNVKPGYARNFLLPQKKALRATDENKAHFETQKAQLEADNLKRREEAQSVGDKMDGLSVTLVRQAGDAGQLYGSVSARDIADSIIAEGFTINRDQVVLERPIKAIGIHTVNVTLHPEVTVKVTTNVARSQEEAEIQAKTGEAIKSAEELQDIAEAESMVKAEAAAEAAEEIFEEGAVPDFEEEAEPDAVEAEAAEATDEVSEDAPEEASAAEDKEEKS